MKKDTDVSPCKGCEDRNERLTQHGVLMCFRGCVKIKAYQEARTVGQITEEDRIPCVKVDYNTMQCPDCDDGEFIIDRREGLVYCDTCFQIGVHNTRWSVTAAKLIKEYGWPSKDVQKLAHIADTYYLVRVLKEEAGILISRDGGYLQDVEKKLDV